MSHDLTSLIDSLSRPEAYPHAVDEVEVHQTHISIVFLAGPFAYKVKKPVSLGFLDFSTLEQRKHFCHEEVRLNRRLAPQVYLDVVPIAEDTTVGGTGSVIEWAVKMQRLDVHATLAHHLSHDQVTVGQMETLARRIAAFHRNAARGAHVAPFGRFDVVAQNARDNFTQSQPFVGSTVSAAVFERIRVLTDEQLTHHRARIETRAEQKVPCDTHGDLRLDHVYLFPDQAPPNDVVIIDCIEFADRFRFADPVADMAFLAMDLTFHGRRDLADTFADAYFAASGDADGRALMPFYSAYRSVVRAKVRGMELREPEIDEHARQRALERAKAHWLLALVELEAPSRKPALVLLAGLPGGGKSTIAKGLSTKGNFHLLRSDVIRKELAGVTEMPTAEFHQGIYSDEWTERTYAELLRRAEDLLWRGERVMLDANFRENQRRQRFFDAARRWAVPIVFVECKPTPEVAHARLQARRGDASDADWAIYQQLQREWQPVRDEWQRVSHCVDTSGSISENDLRVETILREKGLL